MLAGTAVNGGRTDAVVAVPCAGTAAGRSVTPLWMIPATSLREDARP
jgi:hypothetical protein